MDVCWWRSSNDNLVHAFPANQEPKTGLNEYRAVTSCQHTAVHSNLTFADKGPKCGLCVMHMFLKGTP